MRSPSLLRIRGLTVQYGGVRALDDVDAELAPGEIVALIGPNGAGKSSILKSVYGLAPIDRGEIIWRGEPFRPVTHRAVRRGLAYVPQGKRVLPHLTVEENLEIGGYSIRDRRMLRRRVDDLLEAFPLLQARRKDRAGTLSGGQQQIVALGRALMVKPDVLLLDEPSLGLAPKSIKEVFREIAAINERERTAIMIVEHNLKSLLEIADRAYLLDKGRVIATGPAAEIVRSDVLERVFMGKATSGG